MLLLVRLSLVLVSLLFVVHVSEAFPLKEWLLSRSGIDDVDSERTFDAQRFAEDSYTSPKRMTNEDDQELEVFADENVERDSKSQDVERQRIAKQYQCRFGGCGK